MLRTKYLFLAFFLGFLGLFALVMIVLIYSNLQTLLYKQYEQKLKTINDVLEFKLLTQLDENNIIDFAQNLRIDLIIKKDSKLIASFKDTAFFLNSANESIQKARIKNKALLYKAYIYNDIEYILIVYPRILELKGYWSKLVLIFFLFALFLFFISSFFAKKLSKMFRKILIFLDKIDKKDIILLDKSLFKELNIINNKLYKTKEQILKNQRLAKKQNQKISLKNTQLSSVISAISHELNNPLSVINLSLQTLKNPHFKDAQTQAKLFDKIAHQSAKLNMLTKQLNLVFNLNLNESEKENFELYELCEKIVQNYDRVKLEGEKMQVRANAFLIEQVLINLLSNALKYSKDEVILSIWGRKISVKDKGIGIAKDKIKFITKKFYKIEAQNENSFGLGLFLVKKILALHKSHLEISSQVGLGSEFSFVLE